MDRCLQILAASPDTGIASQEAAHRLAQYGTNRLPTQRRGGHWRRLARQFRNPLIYVLLAAGAITFQMQDSIDAGVILVVVLVNAITGFLQEGKAEKALNAVRRLLPGHATVLRDGVRQEIETQFLVPGDIVLLETGARVPADLRLLQVKNLRIDEAAITGESNPVEKSTAPVTRDAPIGDRTCMAYSGTVVRVGRAQGLVVATGDETEIGRIGTLVAEIRPPDTPLTRRLDQFARQVTSFTLAAGAATFFYGYVVRRMSPLDITLAVVGLAVAAIPEGLPAVVTIVLATGARAMARNNAIVRRLPAVETLGSVTVICSDKTGTITKNEMTVARVALPGRTLDVEGVGYATDGGFRENGVEVAAESNPELQDLARCALLCNDSRLDGTAENGWQLIGDPTEGALVTLARKAGLDAVEAADAAPRIDEIPFDPTRRFMATLHHDATGRTFLCLKGAPESVFDLCVRDTANVALDQPAWMIRVHEAALAGQRVLALAQCEMSVETRAISLDDLYPRFTLLGLVGLIDPPRQEAIDAVADCQRAGLRVKIITGDHAVTAAAIGRQVGLTGRVLTGASIETMDAETLRRSILDTDVFARANPEHKLLLVTALRAQGDLVAMTGDGVNDAPALRAADIGVAMGHKGTDAAREAADLVLTDDNFATIVHAVREGRVVFDNIEKSLLFMLPTNSGEAGVILLAVVGGYALPVTAGQILWVNTATAVTLALALAFEPAEPGIMERPPRPPSRPLITPVLAFRIIYVTLLMIGATFAVFEWELVRGSDIGMARTAATTMLVIGELVYLFTVRHFTAHAFTTDLIAGNPVALWMSIVLIAMQLSFTYLPVMQRLFETVPLDIGSWLVIVALGFGMFLAVEAEKAIFRRLHAAGM